MEDNYSKYANSKYKSKYLKYKNKYLLEKHELQTNQIINKIEINQNLVQTNSIKKTNLNNSVVKTFKSVPTNLSKINTNVEKIGYTRQQFSNPLITIPTKLLTNSNNLNNIEIIENGLKSENILNKTFTNFIEEHIFNENTNTNTNTNTNRYGDTESGKNPNKKTSKKSSKKTSKKSSKKLSKKTSKKTSKKSSKDNNLEKAKGKIYEKVNWNQISKIPVEKVTLNKNKIVIKFNKITLELNSTKTLDETTWFEKFIKS